MKYVIYMAGGISDLTWDQAQEWRDRLDDIIVATPLKKNWCTFDPCKHINDFGEVIDEREAVKYDLDMLRRSRLMVVSFEHTQKSIGTAIELGVAHENNIPIIGYNPNDVELHPWIREICTHICTSWEGLTLFLCDHYLNEG